METTTETKNLIDKKEYVGGKSTLCVGCGHDQITGHIISACHQLQIDPYEVLKMSGIGCSSKTPGYFLSKSYGFNSLHGRMAPVATGARVSKREFHMLGVSGDGDSSSIGLGGFVHLMRRNVPMTYLIANNGVYGLTKGQFSATADKGSKLKSGEQNPFSSIDLCSLALDVGCTFVARSFSGDAKQLVPLIKAALHHRGTALIDIISPCVAFNNHDGSTKSFMYVKEHDIPLQELGFIGPQESINVDYAEGTTELVKFPDGSQLSLKKLDQKAHNVSDKINAMRVLQESREQGQILTGLFYINESLNSLPEDLNLSRKSLCAMDEKDLRMTKEQFDKLLRKF